MDRNLLERRTLRARLHNPMGLTCGCPGDCWCKTTQLGRLVRWYVPREYHAQLSRARKAARAAH
ncbi:MAG TPA: hypothetical protein VG652_06445 [Gaiellaceae bacterium]|nr:hypothetical protein [Gaiellaceae bacterium]